MFLTDDELATLTWRKQARRQIEAQRQLGHASVTMTEAYVRLGQKVTPTR